VTIDPRVRRPSGSRLAVIALIGVVVACLAPVAALASDGPAIKLLLRPVDQPVSFFDLTIAPGQTRTLEVDLGNGGAQAISARTYAADVYTIINGGFGGRLRDQPQTGMTGWVDYRTQVLRLAVGEVSRRSFKVAVPVGTASGEYITSLVVENETPILDADEVGLDQIIRQAVAIVVTVPGPRVPALAIGDASHDVVVGNSVVRVAIENTGNVRLKPIVEFTLLGPTGRQVSRATLQMDTFYAHTSTFVEFPLAALLLPGTYTVRLALDDAPERLHTEQDALAFVVEAPVSTPAQVGVVPSLIAVIQGGDGGPPVAIVLALLASIVLVVVAGLVVRRRRQRRLRLSRE
jgi:hypothetical protein